MFRDIFIHFTFLGFKNVKINVFCEKIILGAFLSNRGALCLQTDPGDLKNPKHLKFDIRQIFTNFKKNEKKNHIFPEF